MELTIRDLLQIIPWIISLVAIVHNFHNDDGKFKERLYMANIKLDQVCDQLNEIRLDTKSTLSRVEKIETSQAVHEKEIRTAFSRIDETRETIKNLQREIDNLGGK